MYLLPPSPDKCPCCAVKHDREQPHDATSLFYSFWFHSQFDRSPTWNDAIAHCSPEVKESWLHELRKIGIDPSSTKTRGDIKSKADLDARLAEEKA